MVVSITEAQNIVLQARAEEHTKELQREEQRQQRNEQFVSLLESMVQEYCQEVLNEEIKEASKQGRTSLASWRGVGPNMIASWLKEKFELKVWTASNWGTPTWNIPWSVSTPEQHPWKDAWSKYDFHKIEGWDEWDNRPAGLDHIALAFGEALTKVLTEAGYKVSNTLSTGLKEGCKEKQIVSGEINVSWATGQLAKAS